MARSMRFTASIGKRFVRDAQRLANKMTKARDKLPKTITKALENVGKEWEAGAKLRAPYDTGEMEADIQHEVIERDEGFHELAVGTNAEYAVFVEFGTARIAGGAVLAIGDDPHVTDAQAVKTWKALEEDGPKPSPTQEQMPWLRPSFWALDSLPTDALNEAVEKAMK